MNTTTPTKISRGDSHDRSNEKTTVISAVPTSAPSITASAGAVAINPWPTNEATIRQVAVLDCTSPVTTMPAPAAQRPVAHAAREHLAQVLAEHAQDAGAHDVRAPDEQRDRREQVQQMDHRRVTPTAANRSWCW